jgi:hypothetical protein
LSSSATFSASASASLPVRRPGPAPLPASMALLEAAIYVLPAPARLPRPLCPSSAPPPSSAIREHWLDSSLAESSRRKNRGPWEECCAFAASHRISALPPDEYAAEQFIIEKAETTRSVASVETAVASINHLCASSPAFGLILRGIRRDCGCLAVPRQPFTAGHIRLFLDLAWGTEDFGIWRGVFGHVTCFQQLMRASEAFGLTGANLVVGDGVVKFVNVKAKNWQFGYPVPFSFPVEDRPYCVGRFVFEYLKRFGIKVGNASHFIACKVTTKRGGTSVALPLVQVSARTMFASNKAMIKRIGLDPTCFA